MSANAPFTPPKKKPNVLWWLAGGFALLVFVFFLQLFGPNPPIVVSRQTTYITSPLGPDGLPDYERYVLEKSREGVTPENNAAVLIWQALWPGELDARDYAAVATELGLEKIPSKSESLDGLYGKANHAAVFEWLQDQFDSPSQGDAADGQNSELVDDVFGEAMSRPWTSEQIPPLAKWVAANKKPLDMLVEASHQPRCYFPSPSLLNPDRESLIEMLLPGVQSAREAGRSLPTRAMWHVGEGRADEAWQDLLAVHRIGRLTAQGQTLVEQLVGIAIDGIARDGTIAMLDQGQRSPAQARKIQRDLASLSRFSAMADSIDKMDRLMFLDAMIHQASGRLHGQSDEGGGNLGFLGFVSVDWNIALLEGNRWFDRLVNACRIVDRSGRSNALDQIEAQLKNLELEKERRRGPAIFISRKARSGVVASIYVSLMLPAADAAMNAQDQANTKLDLERLAAALAVYRTEHGAYPEKLDELVAGVVDKLPVDLYNAKPFIYQRDGAGYLLYSAGENGIDDGGSSEMLRTLNGRPADQFDPAEAEEIASKIPAGTDDFSIRVPTPKWEPPKRPATTGEP